MSDENKKENIDLDSILSEINSTISKEVSKTNSVKPKGESKAAKKPAAPRSTTPKPKKPAIPKPPPQPKPKIDSAFAKSAKIIEHAMEDDEDEALAGHAVRFIAVTASEVIEDPIPSKTVEPPNVTPNISGSGTNVSVISDGTDAAPISLEQAAPKPAPAPDVARDNSRQIQKLRKRHAKRSITKRQRLIAIIGAIVTVLVVFGSISVVIATGELTFHTINKTSVKQELAEAVFPFVIIDIPEFDDIKKLDNSAIISSAIWSFIINEQDKTKYAHDDMGSTFVPDVDIELYIRRLFGNDMPIKHQSVDNTSVMMLYDETNKTYTIESTPKILPYRPRVDKVSRKDDLYTLRVSYLLPDAMWNFESKNKNDQVGKEMEYVLKKNKNSYQIISVKLLTVMAAVTPEQTSSNNMMSSELMDDSDPALQIEISPLPLSSAISGPVTNDEEATSSDDGTTSDGDDTSSKKSTSSDDDDSSTSSKKRTTN